VRRRELIWLLGALSSLACAAGVGPAQSAGALTSRRGERRSFVFPRPNGGFVSSKSVAGRATALVFITTFDLASQALAQRLDDVLRSHKPRANGVGVVLEPPKYAEFAQAFADSLSLSYPIAMADQAALRGAGAFGDIRAVPVLVVIDWEAREVARFAGVPSVEQISDALASGAR